ncbi:asialoglycoprotein receptor 1-like [Schistocerca nitens]|uniref:asialoglycoprotein receptor 1-like n=1 Tax=Schistocerca nitens TaxID=7011 RepID=UPI0021181168|nr:asialoglycoprotein receptor 1-like [Schistocerca nitens]
MCFAGQLLAALLLACSAFSPAESSCVGLESSSFCGGDVSAALKLTLTDDPVVPVPIRKRLAPTPATTTAATLATRLPLTTESSTSSVNTEDPGEMLYTFNYEDYGSYEFTHLGPRFDEAEKTAEEKERERVEKERKEYEAKYCADQAGDIEVTNLQDTGFQVPANYEVFPGVGIYRFHRAALPWEEARRKCEKEGAHLLVLNSEEEWNVVDSLMRRCPELLDSHFNYYSYIGVHDMRKENHFETVLGGLLEDTGYVRWMPGQPDNAHHLGENCVTVSRDGAFNDVPCSTPLPYVCEHDSY